MAVDDICPGAFAEPPIVTLWMIPGAVTVDWEGEARRRWQEMGLLPVYENARRTRRELAMDFLRRAPSAMASWAVDMIEAGKATITEADPDAYSFSIGPPTLDNCKPCGGTGEITEYPPDDDERTVACPHCGGTGEVWE